MDQPDTNLEARRGVSYARHPAALGSPAERTAAGGNGNRRAAFGTIVTWFPHPPAARPEREEPSPACAPLPQVVAPQAAPAPPPPPPVAPPVAPPAVPLWSGAAPMPVPRRAPPAAGRRPSPSRRHPVRQARARRPRPCHPPVCRPRCRCRTCAGRMYPSRDRSPWPPPRCAWPSRYCRQHRTRRRCRQTATTSLHCIRRRHPPCWTRQQTGRRLLPKRPPQPHRGPAKTLLWPGFPAEAHPFASPVPVRPQQWTETAEHPCCWRRRRAGRPGRSRGGFGWACSPRPC